ncbi:MAG: Cof-type HAD-IIB family hydrolase [Muribaculaceae bacterium]|nr:Cof-type HAD-IIB family hydrolase [Muribaculaceae bacterium]MDE6321529.1 Cof-type HAD-IIB family hydrolase [Muribaculaceae bacterium]
MQSTTLYVTDLDGTLLNTDSQISYKSATIISDLVRDGAMITVATARTPATVEPLLAGTYTQLPAIVLTGAAMWDRQRRRYIHPKFIDDAQAAEALKCFREADVHPFIYTLRSDGILHVYHNGNMVKPARVFMEERSHLELKKFHLDEPWVDQAPSVPDTVLFFGMGRAEHVYPLAETLRSRVDCAVYSYLDIFNPDVAVIEVFSSSVSKALAIKQLAKRQGAKRIVAFGDSTNDLPMLEIADVAVAVENAIPEVKNAADTVIGRNNSDAVARFIFDDYYG